MFNFLGKNDYTSKCTKILNKETGLDPLIAQAFIEDFKPLFDEEFEKNNDPVETLINAGIIILQHILSETIKEIKILRENGVIIIHRHKKDDVEIENELKILDTRKYGISKIIIGN